MTLGWHPPGYPLHQLGQLPQAWRRHPQPSAVAAARVDIRRTLQTKLQLALGVAFGHGFTLEPTSDGVLIRLPSSERSAQIRTPACCSGLVCPHGTQQPVVCWQSPASPEVGHACMCTRALRHAC